MNKARAFAHSTKARLGAGALALAAAMSLGMAGSAQPRNTEPRRLPFRRRCAQPWHTLVGNGGGSATCAS